MLFAERDGHGAGAGLLRALAGALGRLRRRLRRLAGPRAPQPADVELRRAPRTATSRSTGEIDLAGVDGAFVLALGLRPHRRRRPAHRARGQPAGRLRSGARATYCARLGRLAGARCVRRGRDRRTRATSYRVSHRRAARRTSPTRFPGGDHRQPVDPVGLLEGRRRPRRLPPRLAARPGRERRRACSRPARTTTSRRVLALPARTQEADGHWPQNMWLDGTPVLERRPDGRDGASRSCWSICARREGALDAAELARLWPHGPAGRRLPRAQRPGHRSRTAGRRTRATRRSRWRSRSRRCSPPPTSPTRWTSRRWPPTCARPPTSGTRASSAGPTSRDTDLARRGRRRRLLRAHRAAGRRPTPPRRPTGFVPIKNRPPEREPRPGQPTSSAPTRWRWCASACAPPTIRASSTRSGDRRAAEGRDARRAASGAATTATATASTPTARPFDGTGIGRPWPLLAGERAHYELAAGRPTRRADAARHAVALRQRRRPAARAGLGRRRHPRARARSSASRRARRCRWSGRTPSTSSCAARWTTAASSTLPPQPVAALPGAEGGLAATLLWRFNHKCRDLPAGRAAAHRGAASPPSSTGAADGWDTVHDAPTRDTGLGLHVTDLPTDRLPVGRRVSWTFRWTRDERWEGVDFAVTVRPATDVGS